jgi:hypothetical protein
MKRLIPYLLTGALFFASIFSTFAVKPREIPFPPDAGHEKHDRLRLSNRSYSS